MFFRLILFRKNVSCISGDPYVGCREPPRSPCEPSPCGPGAQCIVTPDGQSMCRCPDGLGGDPTSVTGCQGYECLVDDDCGNQEACISFRCRDPCPGSCGGKTKTKFL